MPTKIRKKNGRKQKYKKAKLISSLQKAGLETGLAKLIVNSLDIQDDMSSGELKFRVYTALEKVDKKAAERYWTSHGLKVNVEVFEADGNVIISKDTMKELGLHTGDAIDVFNGEKFEKVRAFPLEGYGIRNETVLISHHDMLSIGVHPGSRIAVRKHKGIT